MTGSRGQTTVPPLTDDLDRAKNDLIEHGVCRLAGVLPADLVLDLRRALDEIARSEVRDGVDHVYSGGSNQRIWSLFNKGEIFLSLAEHDVAQEMMEAILGPDLIVSNLSANIAGPGGEYMVPHWDQFWAARPWPQALAAHVIWMIDDFTAENGATLVAPGSHLLDGPPADETLLVPATGPAGTALVLDGRTWHGTGTNITADMHRAGILAYYCRPYIRQQENMVLSMHPDVQASLSAARKRFFGFGFHEYLNMVDGPPREIPRY